MYPLKSNKVRQGGILSILESWVLTPLSTILSLMKYTCNDRLSCTVYVTNEQIVHQFMLLFFLYWPYS